MTVSWMLWELVKTSLSSQPDWMSQHSDTSPVFVSSVLSAAEILLELNDLMISRAESFLG